MRVPAILQLDVLDAATTPLLAAALWGGQPATLEHVSTGASFIFRFEAEGRRLYLRLTPPGWQSLGDLRGEATLIETLGAAGISLARPVASRRDELIEPIIDRGNEFLAMVFEEAPGRHVRVPQWDKSRVRRYGRLMAEVHTAAPRSLPAGQTRRDFEEELAVDRSWLPASETEAHAYLTDFERRAPHLPRSASVFGLVHYDMTDDNILWADGEPTLIDFDDCVFTWFASDIARMLGFLLRADPRRYGQLATWWREGYESLRPIDAVTIESLHDFIRLNAIGGLAWCLYCRGGGLAMDDASAEAEATYRAIIAEPGRWVSMICST